MTGALTLLVGAVCVLLGGTGIWLMFEAADYDTGTWQFVGGLMVGSSLGIAFLAGEAL